MLPTVFYCTGNFLRADTGFHHNLLKPLALYESWQHLDRPPDFVAAEPIDRNALLLAHDAAYVDQLFGGQRDNAFFSRDARVLSAELAGAGALLAAARNAIECRRITFALAFMGHHAHYSLERGYCTFNCGIVVGELLRRGRRAWRIGILDFDFHEGDGTAHILRTLELRDYVHYSAGYEYRARSQAAEFLRRIPERVAGMAECDLVLYHSGVDVHLDDQVGGWLSEDQLRERERRVFDAAIEHRLPLVWCLGGGYQRDSSGKALLDRVVALHTLSLEAFRDASN
jgi:acetoin utilization deacetylase AcuC-like enzyme